MPRKLFIECWLTTQKAWIKCHHLCPSLDIPSIPNWLSLISLTCKLWNYLDHNLWIYYLLLPGDLMTLNQIFLLRTSSFFPNANAKLYNISNSISNTSNLMYTIWFPAFSYNFPYLEVFLWSHCLVHLFTSCHIHIYYVPPLSNSLYYIGLWGF